MFEKPKFFKTEKPNRSLEKNRMPSPTDNEGPVCLGFFELPTTKSCCRLPNAPSFSAHLYKNRFGKNRSNQYEHKIGRVVTIVGIHHFLDPKPFGPLHLPPYVIPTILRFFHSYIISTTSFSEKLVRTKLNQTGLKARGAKRR
jgi:hypothetical protein